MRLRNSAPHYGSIKTDPRGDAIIIQYRQYKSVNKVILPNYSTGTCGFLCNEIDEVQLLQRRISHSSLSSHFRPEFLNRIDEVIVFHELTADEVKQIVDLLLVRDKEQLAAQALDLVLTDAAKTFLVEQGYDRQLGARPLRRAIQRYLEDPLAEQVLLGGYTPGSTIVVDVDEEADTLSFETIDTPDVPPVDLVDSSSE